MSTTSAGGGPHNGRRGNATWQSRTSTQPSTQPSTEDEGQLVDPVVRTFRAVRSWRAAALSLLALASTIIVLTAGVALAGALIWPKTYAARAEVLYPITQEQPTGFLREDRSMTTQLILMQGRPILGPIAAQQGRDVEDLQEDLTVTVLESSEIIQLEVRDRSAQRALQTAQAVLTGYLQFSQSGQPTLRERIETELAATATALADAQKLLDDQQALVTAGTAAAGTLVPLQRAVQTQELRQQHLQSQLDSINLAPVAQQLTAPYSVGVVHPRPLAATVTGALVGLLLAACVVVVVARGWMRG
ncbi:MAG: hypothetical protein ABR608_06130 [Pseudonocardiaceae bacterium]